MRLFKHLNLLVICGAIFGGSIPLAMAIPSSELRPQDNQFFLGLHGNHYFNNSNTLADKKSGNIGAKASLRLVSKKNSTFRAALEGEVYQGLANSYYRYFDIGEAFIGAANSNFAVYLGRKKHNWNSLDAYWTMGLYQPRFRWDHLSERQSGIAGLFLQANHEDKLEFTAFYSPIFIPEQGAPFELTNGECKSSSPWFHCPSATVMLFNQTTTVNYRLDVPPISKLISHQAYGATARIGKENKLYARLSYANKPINQFLLAYEGRLDLTTLQLPAQIHLRVLRHELLSAELGANGGKVGSIVFSGIKEKPKRDTTPSNWNTQEVSDATIVGAIARTNMFGLYNTKTRLEFSYLHRSGGDQKDQGPFATLNNSVFEPRFAFRNAFSFSIHSPIKDDWSNRFLFSMKFIVDTIYNGNILSTDMHFKAFPRGFVSFGGDILGSDSLTTVDFISKNQRNDRLRGGFTYVF